MENNVDLSFYKILYARSILAILLIYTRRIGMVTGGMGIVEVFIACIVGLLSLGLLAAILVFLYMIYNKLKTIEELLKKDQ